MVRKIANLVGGEIRGLHEAAYLLGLFAFLSQLLALVRDRLLAGTFGAGETLDVYYAAFRIPDIIFVSVASLVSVYILIPFLSEKEVEGREAERAFISSVFSVFASLILFVSALAFIFTPVLLRVLFPGLAEALLFEELVLLTRLLLLQPIFLGLSNLFGSVTQTRKRFVLYALGPLLYNMGIISGVLVLFPLFGIQGLAFGVVLGALLHLLIQLPFIISHGYLPSFTLQPNWGDVKRVIMVSLPRTFALSANQFALVALFGFASLLAVGSISIFNLAFNLQSVPLAIIGVSYSVAAFPTLTRLFTNGDKVLFLEQITSATRHIIFWSTPAIVLFIVLRAQIVRVILGSGRFDWAETRLVAAALALFSLSLVAQGVALLFVRGYYAAGNTKIPLIVNTLGAVGIVVFSWVFLKLFAASTTFAFFISSLLRVEDLAGIEILMLPLGYSLSVILTALALWFFFTRHFGSLWSMVSKTVLHSLGAAVLMGFTAHRFLDILDEVFDINTFLGILSQGLISGIGGIIVGIILLLLLENEEIKEVWRALHQKFWKSDAIAPERGPL